MNEDEKANKSKKLITGIITGINKEQLNDINLSKKLAYAYSISLSISLFICNTSISGSSFLYFAINPIV